MVGFSGRSGASISSLATLLVAAVVALVCSPLLASALSLQDAGKIDWHLPRVGVPHISSHSATQYLSPRFHRMIKPWQDVRDKAQTAIFVATESNAVAALNPRNGAIVWRQVFDDDDQVLAFVQHSDFALSISGAGGANVRLFHGITGYIVWETSQHDIRDGVIPETGSPGVDAVFLPAEKGDGDILTLANGRTVRRLDGQFGKEAWRWDLDDPQSSRKLVRIIPTADKIHVVAVARSAGTSKIVVYSLSHAGQLIQTREIQSSLPNGSADILTLPWLQRPNQPPSPPSARAHIAWLHVDGSVRAAALESDGSKSAQPQVVHSKRPAESHFSSIVDVGLGNSGLFVARRSDGMGEVIRVDAKGKLSSMWEFEEEAFDAVYSGTYDRSGHAYINRVFFSRAQHLLNFHTFWANANNGGEGQVTGFSFQYDHDLNGNVLAAPFEASPVSQYQLVTRAVLVTSSGSVRMIQEDKVQWLLEEGLSQTTASLIVDLPERKLTTLQGGAAALDSEGFVGRLVRHVISLQDLPSYLVGFAKRFATGNYGALEPAAGGTAAVAPASSGSASTTVVKVGGQASKEVKSEPEKPSSLAPRVASANTTASLYRDPFGFRKLIIATTKRGKIYAIDSIRKETYVWEKSLVGYGQGEGDVEPKVDVKLLSLVRPLSSDGRGPLIVVVAEVEVEAGLVGTRVFELDPLTGEFVDDRQTGSTVFLGQCRDAFLLPIEDADTRQQAVGLVDSDLRLHLFPDTLSVARAFEPLAESFYFGLADGVESKQVLTGHLTEAGVGSVHKSQEVWRLPLPAGETIVSRIPQAKEHVASLGRVLGDRSTLYKFLNPHAELVTTVTPAAGSAHLLLLDTITGAVLYEVELTDIEVARGVQASFVENWIVYTYTVRTPDEGLQTRLVSVELYEQPGADQTWSWFGNLSSFTGDSTNPGSNSTLPLSYSQTFLFAHGVRALSTTSTKFGISLKNLLVATDRDTLISVPRKLLDPRRPLGKPSKSEAEEYMIPYDPLVPNEPKWTLSHVFPVAKLDRVRSAPALLESTSLIFAHGLDSFWTRDAPSGQFDVLQETFNKPQLMLTIAGLSAGILITRPIVRGRALSARWAS